MRFGTVESDIDPAVLPLLDSTVARGTDVGSTFDGAPGTARVRTERFREHRDAAPCNAV